MMYGQKNHRHQKVIARSRA